MTDSERRHGDESEQDTDLRAEVLSAVRAVRREGAKAAVVHAIVDATVVFLTMNLLGLLVAPPTTAPVVTIGLPHGLVTVAWEYGFFIPDAFPIGIGLATGMSLAILVFVLEFSVLYRRYTIETFEAVNPPVKEAFRTARDAASTGDESTMARELYRSVLRGLQGTTTQKFINGRRLTVTVVALLVVSLSMIGVAALGLHIGGDGTIVAVIEESPGTAGGGSGESESDESVLGEREEVERGTHQEAVQIDGDGTGNGGSAGGSYDASGFSVDPQDVDAVAAEYSGESELEDSELIREYNERIRGLDDGN